MNRIISQLLLISGVVVIYLFTIYLHNKFIVPNFSVSERLHKAITVSVFASAGLLGYSFSQLRQYHYVGKSMNWFDAQSYCRRWFTDLATLNSINEVSRVLKVIDPAYTGSFWIGLKRGTYSKWGWSAGNNTLAQYTNWDKSEPTEIPCGMLSSYATGWTTHDCTHYHYLLCFNALATDSSRWILLQTELTWKEAQTLCRKNYTDLASIRNAQDELQIAPIVQNMYYVWIGLFSDDWEWSDLSITTFRYWADSEPGSTDKCAAVAVSDLGRWYDQDCYLTQSFVCYGDMKTVKHQLLRLKVSFAGNTEDPLVLLDALLKQMMVTHRIGSDTALVWRKRNGSVFRLVKTMMTREKCQ
ncbi:C-type lectin 1-like [Astyanax mexicanus]|uniref:C-type lectin 1-like n=1 Tax=Astyanax mexicanus TaxID=7994 RepID=A0A8T2M546_ASTMX|nr:C-type lectin 1-like [Astyanax mexicanus]